jgi:GNAT superfamily N-acetyltransferase
LAIEIREAHEQDLPRLRELLFQLSQLGHDPEGEARAHTDQERAALAALQSDQCCTCLVLEVDGQVVGTLTVYVLPNLSYGGRPLAVVENVVVDERVRSGGYGRLLMMRAEEIARAAGCFKISLTSNRQRRDAHGFYERIGFSTTHHGFTRYLDP